MPQSLETRFWRFAFNHWPCYRRTGGRVTHVEADWTNIKVRLPLNLGTRNYKGTIFGGSMFGAVDPFFMMMIIKTLGPDYLVWDKSGSIRFKRPGRTTLYADCRFSLEEAREIRELLETEESVDRSYTVELRDRDGLVHAIVEKTIFIAGKRPEGDEPRGG